MTFKNIIIGEGGLKGIAILGALDVLFDTVVNIENYYGISIGSIISFLLIIGYTPKEIYKKFDISYKQYIDLDICRLINNNGFDNCNKVMELLIDCIREKGYKDTITFKELYDNTKKKLNIIVTNLTEFKMEIINEDNFKITDAIRMSISVPFLFTPVKYNNCLYVDGYIKYDTKMLKDFINFDETLYIKVKGKIDKKVKNLYGYSSLLIKCIIQKEDNDDIKNTITIITDDVSFDFNMSDAQKKKLYNIGMKSAKKYLSRN